MHSQQTWFFVDTGLVASSAQGPTEKGIVESGVKYIECSYLPLHEFRDQADANRQRHEWVIGTAGNRILGTFVPQ